MLPSPRICKCKGGSRGPSGWQTRGRGGRPGCDPSLLQSNLCSGPSLSNAPPSPVLGRLPLLVALLLAQPPLGRRVLEVGVKLHRGGWGVFVRENRRVLEVGVELHGRGGGYLYVRKEGSLKLG